MPQPATAQQQGPGAGTAIVVGAGAAAGGTAIAATPPAEAITGAAGLSIATAGIMGAFVTFLSALRQQHQDWLLANLAGPAVTRDDIAEVLRDEMAREEAFARNAADRLATKLPEALRIKDPDERTKRVRQILADEERFARQRAEAMAARALAGVERFVLRRESPMGAFWRLGIAQQHTEGCRFMAGKFWPWAVLDRVHPPRHYGCTSSLHGYGEAVLNGWMSPGDVPDTRDAVRRASGVVMEAEEAQAVLGELELRERLLEAGLVGDTALAGIAFKGVEIGTAEAV